MYRGKTLSHGPALLLVVALLVLSGAAAGAAPDLKLQDLSGKARSATDYIGKGRWVIVAVWSADCPICQREMYHMTFLHDERKDKDVRVLGLSIDGLTNRAKAQEFADAQSLNFPNLLGNPGDASRLSGHPLAGTPTYYFFAPDGKFATQRVGALTQAQAERVLDTLKKAR
jgi:peroxiredoxin